MNTLQAKLAQMLASRRIDDEKFSLMVARLAERLFAQNKDSEDRAAAAQRIVLCFRVRLLYEMSMGLSSCETWGTFNRIAQTLFETGKYKSPFEVDISDSSNVSWDQISELLPAITSPVSAVDRSVLPLRHPPLRFGSKVAAMWGRLDERWLIEEEGVQTRGNVAALRAKLTTARDTARERP